MTVSPIVASLAELEERREVLRADGVRWSGLEFESLVRAYAGQLRARGISAGDRVAVSSEPCVRVIAALVAHLRMGVVHVPVNPRYTEAEVTHVMEDSGARLLLREDDLVGWMSHPAEEGFREHVGPEALGMLIYTSGTTGRPKGVMLSHRALYANLTATTGLWRFGPEDSMVLTLPLFHVHGLGLGVLGGLMAGVRLRVHRRFHAAVVVEEFREGATVFMGVPTMYHLLLEHLDKHPEDGAVLGRARLFTAGSAALSAAHFEAFEARTGHRILERYGMTETGFITSNLYEDEGRRRPGSVGFSLPGVRLRLVDEAGCEIDGEKDGEIGEIEVITAGIMDGYWNAPEATAASFREGWFRTGDTGCLEGGALRIIGRTSTDIIKSGGYKIGAREIEDVLMASGMVAEVAVCGMPDPKWGQIVAAFVVPASTAAEDAARLEVELGAYCEARLVDYKRPRRFVCVTSLPRNALGKVQKAALVSMMAQG